MLNLPLIQKEGLKVTLSIIELCRQKQHYHQFFIHFDYVVVVHSHMLYHKLDSRERQENASNW